MKLVDYDRRQLSEARQKLMSVYSWYYGDAELRKIVRRLETIIGKLDQLLEMTKE